MSAVVAAIIVWALEDPIGGVDLAVRSGQSTQHIGVASVVAAVLISPALLLARSRKHFVTIEYKDGEDKQQALVFRVNKGDIRSLLASLEARTGRRVDYQDDDARRTGQ